MKAHSWNINMARHASKKKSTAAEAEMVQLLQEMMQAMADAPRVPVKKSPRKRKGPSTVQDQALELVELASEQFSAEAAHQYAAQAYQLDPTQVDALSILATTTQHLLEQVKYTEAEVELLRQAVPPDILEGPSGQLWLEHSARPYLESLYDLAQAYRTVNRRDDALKTLNDIMRLNENDNQGVRETLIKWYLDWRHFEEAWELVHRRNDGLIAMQFTRALLEFRKEGNSAAARKTLSQARRDNKHVASYLLGDAVLTEVRDNTIEVGGRKEAQLCAQSFRVHWVNTPGALDWLKEQTTRPNKFPGTGPTLHVVKELLQLPQEKTNWVVEYRQIPHFVKSGQKIVLAWCLVVLDTETSLMVGTHLFVKEPSSRELWDFLAQLMLKPVTRGFHAHRPEAIICLHRESMMLLKAHLQNVQIEMITHETIQPLDECYEDLTHAMCRDDLAMPSLDKIENVTQVELEQFHQSATDFYRQAPWLYCGHERPIRIEAPWMREQPFFSILMGALGITPGLSLYYDEKDLQRMMGDKHAVADMSVIEEISCSSVRFDYPHEMSAVNVINVERHGWAIPGPNLYPNIMHIEPGKKVTVPPHDILLLFTSLCEAIPVFVAAREQDQAATFEYTTKGETSHSLKLSWIQEMPAW
jgi:tetratricopeptide (TPR) repeat protein